MSTLASGGGLNPEMENPCEADRKTSLQRIAELKESMLQGMDRHPASQAVEAARSLLDYSEAVIAPDLPESEDSFIPLVISRTVPFISEAADSLEKHIRLMASAHILTNILRSRVEWADDEYSTSQFEDLQSGLINLEDVDMTNPSIDNRLLTIFEGLLELASAFGLSDIDYLDVRH